MVGSGQVRGTNIRGCDFPVVGVRSGGGVNVPHLATLAVASGTNNAIATARKSIVSIYTSECTHADRRTTDRHRETRRTPASERT